MDINEQQKFLAEQLDWCRKQDAILDEIERTLYEMKAIAEYAATTDLPPDEIVLLNQQLDDLKKEIQSLEQQLHEIVH